VVAIRAQAWEQRWAACGEREASIREAQRAIDCALDEQEPLPELTASDVRRAIGLIPSGRATGPCGWSGADIRAVPLSAVDDLAALLRHTELCGQRPSCLGENLIALLPKPAGGGERAITITNMFYSIWTRCRRGYRVSFDAQQEAFWDTAVVGLGGGAFFAAIRRRRATEVAVECDFLALELLLDIEACYGCVDLGTMTLELLELGFDARCLRLILGQYALPRRVAVGQCLTAPLPPQRSAVAGCGWANTMAKGIAYGLLKLWHGQLPALPTIRAERHVVSLEVLQEWFSLHVIFRERVQCFFFFMLRPARDAGA
jgi:hypothetical protein